MAQQMKRDDEIIIAKSYPVCCLFFPDENPTWHCYVGKGHDDSNTRTVSFMQTKYKRPQKMWILNKKSSGQVLSSRYPPGSSSFGGIWNWFLVYKRQDSKVDLLRHGSHVFKISPVLSEYSLSFKIKIKSTKLSELVYALKALEVSM